MFSRALCCAALLSFLGLVGCNNSSNAPVVIRLDSADAAAPAAKAASSPAAGADSNSTAPAGSSKKDFPDAYQLASPSDPTSVSPVGANPFKSSEVVMADSPGMLNKPAPAVDIPE